MIQRRTLVKAVIAALAPLSMTSAFAAGGPSGAHIGYQHQGQLGAVDMNPYKIAPLTAIIRDAIRCHTNFRHPFNLSWSGKTCDIRRSSKTTS